MKCAWKPHYYIRNNLILKRKSLCNNVKWFSVGYFEYKSKKTKKKKNEQIDPILIFAFWSHHHRNRNAEYHQFRDFPFFFSMLWFLLEGVSKCNIFRLVFTSVDSCLRENLSILLSFFFFRCHRQFLALEMICACSACYDFIIDETRKKKENWRARNEWEL